MKTTLGVTLAATVMVLGAGIANAATVSGDVHTLKLLSTQSAAQDVYWRRYHHRHCWWRWGHRHCRWW